MLAIIARQEGGNAEIFQRGAQLARHYMAETWQQTSAVMISPKLKRAEKLRRWLEQ